MLKPADVLAPMLHKFMKSVPLDEGDQAAILSMPYRLQVIRRRTYLVRDGDTPGNVCLLISGFAYRHKVVGDGGRQILALHMRGDVVDLHNAVLKRADHSVQALTEVTVAYLPVEALRAVAFERPSVGLAMWVDTAVDGSIHREWTANLGRRDAKARVAHLLCEFGVRLVGAGLGDLCQYELPMTQEEIADAVGLTSVHVNRTLQSLAREGFITRSGRAISIVDWEALAGVGDFDPHYLHGHRELLAT